MTTLSSQPYKGTRDYYPEDKAVQNYIFDTWKQVVRSFGYQEYQTPLLEPLEVYLAKSGEELASEQTYAFQDRGERMVAIRPELTPSVSRLVASRRQEMAYPARLFSIANFMRYERPQRGREREFWQLNADVFGAEGVMIEAEVLQLADQLLKAFGATDDMYEIRVNNREVINEIMTGFFGLNKEEAKRLVRSIDRKNKLPLDVFRDQAQAVLGTSERVAELEQILACESVEELPPMAAESAAARSTKELFDALRSLGVTTARFDASLMRGLDYYTGMVFEVFDTNKENNRSLFGGGRYDGLVGMFGVEPLTAVGFAPGLTTTELFLRSHNLLPELQTGVDLYIATVGEVSVQALQLATTVRAQGLTVEVDTSGRKLDKQIKAAAKKGAEGLTVVGENELQATQLNVKNLITGEETILEL